MSFRETIQRVADLKISDVFGNLGSLIAHAIGWWVLALAIGLVIVGIGSIFGLDLIPLLSFLLPCSWQKGGC